MFLNLFTFKFIFRSSRFDSFDSRTNYSFTAREEKKRHVLETTASGRERKFEIAGNLEITLTIRWRRRTCANRVRTSMQLGNNCVGGQPRGPLDNWFPLTSLSRLPLKRHPRTANWHSVYPPCLSLPISTRFPSFILLSSPVTLPCTADRLTRNTNGRRG